MTNSKDHGTYELRAGVVVIGAGGSGLAAAVTAASKGADVVVLEKGKSPGGASAMAEGLFAAESAPQKRMGIDASRDKLFREAMDFAHWKTDPRLIRAYIDKSADTIQWLEDKGIPLDYLPTMHVNQTLRTWHCHPKRAGHLIIKALIKECRDRGVRLLIGTAARRLMLDKKGGVIGVVAESGGKEVKITTKSVVIGSGGYGGNKELLKKYNPDYNEGMVLAGAPNMGDGLLMATAIGAATAGLGTLLVGGPNFITPLGSKSQVVAISREPNTVWVNKNGGRFVDENIDFFPVTANALHRQPGGISFSLFDEAIKETIQLKGTVKSGSVESRPGNKLSDVDKEIRLEVERGAASVADSWDAIAKWIGANPKALKATIDEYNRYCDQGHDELFVKDPRYLQSLGRPPYYALRCGSRILATLGGIKINHRTEVLDQENRPIPGLYAVGNDAGGWEGDTYGLMLSGFALGFAINSGRIAGENAADHAASR